MLLSKRLRTLANNKSTLRPLFEELDPKPGFLRIWPEKDEGIPLVETKYGLAPQGSVLSYQQQQTSKRSSAGGSVAEWSACRIRNPVVPGSSPALATTWICFLVAPSSNPRPRL